MRVTVPLLLGLIAGCATPVTGPCDVSGLEDGEAMGTANGEAWATSGVQWSGAYQVTFPETDGIQVTLILQQGARESTPDERERLAEFLDGVLEPVEVQLGDMSRDGGSATVWRGDDTMTAEHGGADGGTLWISSFDGDILSGCFDLHAARSGDEVRLEGVAFRATSF